MRAGRVPVDIVPVELIAELINEYADTTRSAAGESDDPFTTLEWTPATTAETSHLIETANELHPIYATPDTAARLLNAQADSIGLQHRLDPFGRLVWVRPTDAGAVRAAATASLIDFITRHGIKPLGTCQANRCADVFIDRSQGHRRIYCSDQCNNRSRAARWRARQRTLRESDQESTP